MSGGSYSVPPAMARLIDGDLANPQNGDQAVYIGGSGLWEKSSSASIGTVSLQPGVYVDGAVIEQIDSTVGNCKAVPRFAVIQSSFTTGSIGAGASVEFDYEPYVPLGVASSAKYIILNAGAHENSTNNLFDLWELGWRTRSAGVIGPLANLTGYLAGAGVTVKTNMTPTAAPVNNAFKIRVTNHDAVARDIQFRVAVL